MHPKWKAIEKKLLNKRIQWRSKWSCRRKSFDLYRVESRWSINETHPRRSQASIRLPSSKFVWGCAHSKINPSLNTCPFQQDPCFRKVLLPCCRKQNRAVHENQTGRFLHIRIQMGVRFDSEGCISGSAWFGKYDRVGSDTYPPERKHMIQVEFEVHRSTGDRAQVTVYHIICAHISAILVSSWLEFVGYVYSCILALPVLSIVMSCACSKTGEKFSEASGCCRIESILPTDQMSKIKMGMKCFCADAKWAQWEPGKRIYIVGWDYHFQGTRMWTTLRTWAWFGQKQTKYWYIYIYIYMSAMTEQVDELFSC